MTTCTAPTALTAPTAPMPPIVPAGPGYGHVQPPPLPAAYPGRRTPHGVLAPWGLRVAAFAVDALVALLAELPFLLVLLLLDDPPALVAALLRVGVWLAGTASLVGNRVVRSGRDGRSIGRQVVGLRLVDERSGRPLGGPTSLARELVHVVDGVLCLGYLRALVHPKGLTWADSAVGSIVVRDQAGRAGSGTISCRSTRPPASSSTP